MKGYKLIERDIPEFDTEEEFEEWGGKPEWVLIDKCLYSKDWE